MDLYNPPPEKPTPQYSMTTAALPQSGMKPDTTVYRRTVSARALSPEEQRDLYKDVQKGGDVPLAGLRMSAPQKPKGTNTQLPYLKINFTKNSTSVNA